MKKYVKSTDFKDMERFTAVAKRYSPRIRCEKGDKIRCLKEAEDTIFVFGKRRSRYGYRLSATDFDNTFDAILEDKAVAWEKRVAKVIKKLEESGLWPEKLEFFKNLQKMSWADREELKALYITKNEDARERGYRIFKGKYPFAFFERDGCICPDCDYLYELSEAKMKSMYFGKYRNAEIKSQIKEALQKGANRLHLTARTSYDVTFDYDPESKKAWYSEEYKDCGNGHYYFALDADTALFVEDD